MTKIKSSRKQKNSKKIMMNPKNGKNTFNKNIEKMLMGLVVLLIFIYVITKNQLNSILVPSPEERTPEAMIGENATGDEIEDVVLPSGEPPKNILENSQLLQQAKGILDRSNESEIVDGLKDYTKGSTKIAEIELNGKIVPKEIIQTAMFENADFMPPAGHQVDMISKDLKIDKSIREPTSMFGPIRTTKYITSAHAGEYDELVNDFGINVDVSIKDNMLHQDNLIRQ
jgi:hypothetical protein